MKAVQVTGHVNDQGKLELGDLPAFTPGEDLHVLIMESEGITALEKIIEIAANANISDPELLAQLEALDEALWDIQFANSKDALRKLANQTYDEYKQGKTVPLNLEELKSTYQ
jgi:hypothetical protein